jgi:hypothetical protein
VTKDRAAPFSRKHRLYWFTVTGGMILIGLINIIIGFLSYDEPSTKTEKMELTLPKIYYDAGIDAAPPDATPGATGSN